MKKTHYFLFIIATLFLISFVQAQGFNSTFKNGLVGYWGFNEGTGTTTADSLGIRNGTLINGTNGNVTWYSESSCKNGDCLRFREIPYGFSDGYGLINISNAQNLFSASQPWAVSFWINAESSTGIIMTSSVDAEGDKPTFTIEQRGFSSAGLSPIMRRADSDGEGLNMWEATWDVNQWLHYVVTFDGGQINSTTMRVYKNGNLVSMTIFSDTCSAGNDNNSYLSFGSGLGGNIGIHGYLDEIAFYNRSLSNSEIQSLSTGIYYSPENESNETFDVPFVTLNSPANLFTTANNLVTFNCSATDDEGIANITLFIDGSPFHNFYNTTATQNLLSSQIVVNFTNETTYSWTCVATDIHNDISVNQATRTFIFSTVVPPTPSVTGSSISSIMSDFGAGIGIFILSILPALAIFLIVLAFVIVIIIVAKEIKESGFKSFTNGRVGVK